MTSLRSFLFHQLKKWPGGSLILAKCGRLITKIDCQDHSHIWADGVYIQDSANIHIGKGCYFAANVGVIASNHVPSRPADHFPDEPIWIGDNCCIGMNAVILPGVRLGNNCTVGAGSIVTKSFPDNSIIAGNPAKVIK